MSDSLTVLHTESSSGWGGQENRTLQECLGLKKLGCRPVILCRPESKLGARAKAEGIAVYFHPLRGSYDMGAVWFLMRLIKKEHIDVISTHSGTDSFVGAIAGRLSSRRPRIVRTRHLALPITSKATYSVFPHKVVAVSAYVRDYLVRGKGIPEGKVISIPTGVDLKRFDPDKTPNTFRRSITSDEGALIVGTVAILRRKKGHHVLLDAAPAILGEVPDAVFVFAGDGPQRENIEARIKSLGIEKNVRLLGLRPDVPEVLKGIDLFVLPTLQEALGTSILEASAMGKAVVASSVGGVPEVVVNGQTGLLVPAEDAPALATAIIRLLKDRELRVNMGKNGRKLVEAEYSTVKMAEKMRSLYVELTGMNEERRGGAVCP